MPLIRTLEKQGQMDFYHFEDSFVHRVDLPWLHIVRPYQKTKQNKKFTRNKLIKR